MLRLHNCLKIAMFEYYLFVDMGSEYVVSLIDREFQVEIVLVGTHDLFITGILIRELFVCI